MKIAFLSFFSGLNYRGVETFVDVLGRGLVKSGHQVTVYRHAGPDRTLPYQTAYLSSVRVLPGFNPVPDIVFPTNGRWQSYLSKIWALKNHKKIVISGQSGPGLDDRLNLYSFPDAFVGLTDFQCAWAKKVNPFISVVKIPNGVDTGVFHPGVKPRNLPLPHPIVLCVAALEPIKRLDLLIAAVARTRASLLIVGRGSLQSSLTELADRLLPGRFLLYPQISRQSMPSIFTACDLFAYPTSPWESFGIVLLEAMASGLPVVATSDPIREEIVGRAGNLVEPENIAGFSRVLEKTLHANLGHKPQDQAKNFEWDKIINSYQKLFLTLV